MYSLDLAVLFGSSGTAPEESCAQVTKMISLDSFAFKRPSGPDQSRGVLLQPCQIQHVLKVDFTGQNGCHSDGK